MSSDDRTTDHDAARSASTTADTSSADAERMPKDKDTGNTKRGKGVLKRPQLHQLVRRRGVISGWLIAWPFFMLTLTACAIAAFFQWMQRPQLVLFTVGLYLCMAFFAHAYSIAWQTGKHVRQMLAMLTVIAILIALIALHLDDGSARWVYRDGQRILRPKQPLLRLAVALDILAIIVILSHGLGLGFGHRFFHKESGTRVSRSMARELLRDVRDRFRGDADTRDDAPQD